MLKSTSMFSMSFKTFIQIKETVFDFFKSFLTKCKDNGYKIGGKYFSKLLHGSIDIHGFSTRKLLTFTFALSHLLSIWVNLECLKALHAEFSEKLIDGYLHLTRWQVGKSSKTAFWFGGISTFTLLIIRAWKY